MTLAVALDLGWALLLAGLACRAWRDVRALADRLVTLREQRLAADLASEARMVAVREAAERAMQPVDLPPDLEMIAAQWADDDAAESTRKVMREQFADLRAKGASEADAWRQVRATAYTTDGAPALFSLDGMLS